MAKSNSWHDIHIAYQVAKLGTLSAAASHLNVHHSTVLRHIDALEQRLDCKLFHRHARGYAATEQGQLLFQEAHQTQERFDRMLGKLAGKDTELSGTLVITSVSTMSPLLMPIIALFQQQHPNIQVELAGDARIFKLEYGEAHVSIRPGVQPKDPDYVVQLLSEMDSSLYASQAYINKYGPLKSLSETQGHKFVSTISPLNNIASQRWMNENVDKSQIVFRGSDFNLLRDAVENGLGIAPLNCQIANVNPSILQLIPSPTQWDYKLWLVTHRDIHHSPKVQAFTKLLKEVVKKTWHRSA
jgi:DNA-binding transcriptional LysR family regulator